MASCFLTVKTENCGQIKGETTQKGFDDYIEIESFAWGESYGAGAGTAAGGSSGKVQMQDWHFMAKLTKASVALMKCCASGDPVQEAVFKCVRESAGGKQVYWTVTLKDGIVSSLHLTGAGTETAASNIPMVDFSISFAQIEMEYKPQSPTDASLGPPHRVQHDLRKGK